MNLKTKVLNALGWSLSAKLFGQLINWGITLYVIRILTPSDYGVMALAMVFITLLMSVTDFGLGEAIIQREYIDDSILQKIFGFILIATCAGTAIMFLSAPLVGYWFEMFEIVPILRVLSLGLIISGLAIIPTALLRREIEFKQLSIIQLLAALAGGLLAYGLAKNDYGVWALVWSFLASAFLRTVGIIYTTKFRVAPSFNMRGIPDVLSFGTWLTAERLVWSLSTQVDKIILGKLLGKEILGLFSVAMHVATLPQSKVQGIINAVAFPAYSNSNIRSGDPIKYLMKQIRLSLFFAVPVFFGISVIAPQLVSLVLGSKWERIIIPIQLITLVVPLRIVGAAIVPYLHALGQVKTTLEYVVMMLVILSVSLVIGANWNLLGVSIAWILAELMVFPVFTMRASKVSVLKIDEVWRGIFRITGCGAFMYAVTFVADKSLPENISPIASLTALILAGSLSYSLIAWVFARGEIQELLNLVGLKHIRLSV